MSRSKRLECGRAFFFGCAPSPPATVGSLQRCGKAHEPRTTNIVPSQRTKEESFDPLENCSFSYSVVAREGPLVDWCCCAIFFAFSKEALHTRKSWYQTAHTQMH